MPRPRKPTALLVDPLFRHDPQRRRDGEPKSNGPVGAPPAHFDKQRRMLWDELLDLLPEGVAFRADRILMEVTVDLWAKIRNAHKRGRGQKSEALPASVYAQFLACLGRLGLTPSDRSRIRVPEPSSRSTNPFANLAGGPVTM